MQVIGVGSQDTYQEAQEFLGLTEFTETSILWERTGNFWRLNNVRTNSSMQLFSFDLAHQSSIIFFNDDGREIVLNASIQQPWKPA